MDNVSLLLLGIKTRHTELKTAIEEWRAITNEQQLLVSAPLELSHRMMLYYPPDVDALLAEVERLRQECERLRAALTDARRDEGYP